MTYQKRQRLGKVSFGLGMLLVLVSVAAVVFNINLGGFVTPFLFTGMYAILKGSHWMRVRECPGCGQYFDDISA